MGYLTVADSNTPSLVVMVIADGSTVFVTGAWVGFGRNNKPVMTTPSTSNPTNEISGWTDVLGAGFFFIHQRDVTVQDDRLHSDHLVAIGHVGNRKKQVNLLV